MIVSTNPDFQLIESILWNGSYFLLAQHLERLESSSGVLGFEFDRDSVEECLAGIEADKLTRGKTWKVRLVLPRDGTATVETQEIEIKEQKRWRLAVSSIPTNTGDIFLYHKTTSRSLYNTELKKCRALGYDEVLFCNERDEVTEGAISNIIARIRGQWVTPDVSCGLLAGVYRRYLLERRENRLLPARISLRDLSQAEEILLCNSVRGCLKVAPLECTTTGSG